MQQKVQEEAWCIYTSSVRASKPNFVQGALSDELWNGFKSAKDGLKAASIHFLKQALMKMAQNGSIDKTFYRNIERWAQPSTFTNALVRQALDSSLFVRSVAKFIRKILKKQSGVIDKKKSPQNSWFSFPKTPSLPSQSSGDRPYRSHAKASKIETGNVLGVAKKRKKQNKEKTEVIFIEQLDGATYNIFSEKGLLILNLSKVAMDWEAHKVRSTEAHLPVLQTIKNHYTLAVHYQDYCIFNRLSL